MTLKQVDEILKGTFADEADRLYWIEKRQALAIKEQNAKENERYFDEMVRYDY